MKNFGINSLSAFRILTLSLLIFFSSCSNKASTIKVIRHDNNQLWILSYDKNGNISGANSYFKFNDGDTVTIKINSFHLFFTWTSPICE